MVKNRIKVYLAEREMNAGMLSEYVTGSNKVAMSYIMQGVWEIVFCGQISSHLWQVLHFS